MTDLADTLGTSETETLEFKRNLDNRGAISKAICALANDLPGKGGGTLLIGVRDDGTPHEMLVDDKILLSVVEFRNDARLLPPPALGVTKQTFAGQAVIRVDVTASHSPPVRFDGTVYVRVGPSTRQAFVADERVLAERRQGADLPSDQRAVSSAGLDDLDLELFRSTYLPVAVSAQVIDENERPVEHQLASLRLASAEGVPTVAGLVVLGLDPTAHVPGAYVQFIRYAGTDVTSDIPDQVEIRGNLATILTRLEAKLSSLITTALVQGEGFKQHDVPSFPFDAIREMLVNALVHRSYQANSAVRVHWFDDRLEIINPGGPYGQVTNTNFDRINDYRNPTLAEAAKNLGYMNRFGRGVSLVRAVLERNGNPEPEFAIEPQFWSVIMRARP